MTTRSPWSPQKRKISDSSSKARSSRTRSRRISISCGGSARKNRTLARLRVCDAGLCRGVCREAFHGNVFFAHLARAIRSVFHFLERGFHLVQAFFKFFHERHVGDQLLDLVRRIG